VTVPSSEEARAALEAKAEKEAGETKDDEAEGEDGPEAEEQADEPQALGVVTPLITGAGVEGSPRWSPDGRWIAYVSTGSQPEPIGLGDVFIVPAGGGDAYMLAETPNRSANILGWAADSRELYLGEVMGTTVQVVALPIDGEAVRPVTSGQGVFGSVSMTPDTDRMAFTWQTPDQPWDVYVSDTDAFAPQRVTDIHADVARPAMGRTELLSWTAPDGTPVEGLLTYPVDYEEGRQVPLILNVHGGPAGVYTQGFTGSASIYMLQYFAQEGFAVLRPNPRGSTGYGKDFRYANFRDWGYGDLSDLMSGVDHVIEMGVAHPDSLLLMGWSYGGYMTSFAVTQTDRFRAASMGAGLPNLVSMTTTTDIGDYLVGHMGAEYWEDYETYEKHSAVYHIANVVTPTQVIHGANDLRVPFTQGQEFYRSLLRLGVPTEMIVYPRTPHGPREPKFVMDVSERILTWFNKHLGKDPDEQDVTASAGGAE
jgi:dipeptidyl aminopeptidase/acylaminoacyl peptidase